MESPPPMPKPAKPRAVQLASEMKERIVIKEDKTPWAKVGRLLLFPLGVAYAAFMYTRIGGTAFYVGIGIASFLGISFVAAAFQGSLQFEFWVDRLFVRGAMRREILGADVEEVLVGPTGITIKMKKGRGRHLHIMKAGFEGPTWLQLCDMFNQLHAGKLFQEPSDCREVK